MTHDTDRDQFYLREFIAPILPVAMALASAYVFVLWLIDLISRTPAWPLTDALGLGVSVLLLLLAVACRHAARNGAFHTTALVAITFGGLFAVGISLRAWHNGDGLLTVLPPCMMLLALGSIFAQRLWHLLAAYTTIMGPAIVLAARIDPAVSSEGQYYPHVALLTLTTVIAFYVLIGLIKRRYYEVLVDQLERAARDSLTSLLNRTAWQERATRVLRDAAGAGAHAVLFLDVDHFKCVNDRIGHAMGDHVLIRVANLLRQAFGPDALVSRYGGEEFVVLLAGGGRAEAEQRAARLQASLALQPVPELAVTMSIGIALYEPGETLDALVLRADRALLAAKARGRNCIVVAPHDAEHRTVLHHADASSARPALVGPLRPAPAMQASEA